MLKGSCHCGAIQIQIPHRPTEITNCNCSICRRLGVLWAYYDMEQVQVKGHPALTQTYSHGDKSLQMVRCKICGCTSHWEPIGPEPGERMGVNIRNFEPELVGTVRMRLLDGADSWTSTYWDPPAAE